MINTLKFQQCSKRKVEVITPYLMLMIIVIITFFEQNTGIITVIKGKNSHDYEHKR